MEPGKVFKNEHDPWHASRKLVHGAQSFNIKIPKLQLLRERTNNDR